MIVCFSSDFISIIPTTDLDDEMDILIVMYLLLAAVIIHRRRIAERGRLWVHPMNQERDTSGLWISKIANLRMSPERFFQYFRMTPESFDYLLDLIRSDITKEDTVMHKAITPDLRLAITLHHLAEGASHASIAMHYSLGSSTVAGIIFEMCESI